MAKTVKLGNFRLGRRQPLMLIAGPCVIENRKSCLSLARKLAALSDQEGIPFVFKASYDKANRSSHKSFRGPGIEQGLDLLAEVRDLIGVPVLTDVHQECDVARVAEVVDVIQIPAFLCRQTDLLIAAGETKCAVNVKKGQFLAPLDMLNIIRKIENTGNQRIILTERGVSFGYNNLVADMRSLLIMKEFGYPVVFDATHSVQRPGGAGDRTSGDGRWAADLARAAVATGCDGVFLETHINPGRAQSDKDTLLPFSRMKKTWKTLRAIHELVETSN